MAPRLVVGVRTVVAASALALPLLLVSCGGEETGAPARPSASSTTSDPTASDTASEATTTTPSDVMTLADLPEGPPPRIDVVIDSTLIHDGTEIELDPARHAWSEAMGTHDGRPILAVQVVGGAQFVAVADDGTTTPLGEPHEYYNYAPRLVPESGHLLLNFDDRGTGRSMYTVLDASTGEELAVLLSADLSSLEPADRAVVDLWSGARNPRHRLLAVSPDGSLAITRGSRPGSPAGLTVGPVGPDEGIGDSTTLDFKGRFGALVFESNDAFLVRVGERDEVSGESMFVVLRCTIDGACERTTQPVAYVSIAGANPVHLD